MLIDLTVLATDLGWGSTIPRGGSGGGDSVSGVVWQGGWVGVGVGRGRKYGVHPETELPCIDTLTPTNLCQPPYLPLYASMQIITMARALFRG